MRALHIESYIFRSPNLEAFHAHTRRGDEIRPTTVWRIFCFVFELRWYFICHSIILRVKIKLFHMKRVLGWWLLKREIFTVSERSALLFTITFQPHIRLFWHYTKKTSNDLPFVHNEQCNLELAHYNPKHVLFNASIHTEPCFQLA